MCRNNRYTDDENYKRIDLAPWMISPLDGTVRSHEGAEEFWRLETMTFPIPSYVNLDKLPYDRGVRKVILLLDARDLSYSKCPHCKSFICHPTLVIVLDDFHILPCILCDNMVWVVNNKLLKVRFEKYHEVTI